MHPAYIEILLVVIAALSILLIWNWRSKASTGPVGPLTSQLPQPIPTERAKVPGVSLYGDSISVTSELGQSIPGFTNKAIAGSCLTDLTTAYFGLLPWLDEIRSNPAGVIISNYGRNDAAFGRATSMVYAMLQAFVNTAREMGKVPVLCSLTAEFYHSSELRDKAAAVDGVIYAVANQMNVHYIDMHAVEADEADTIDGVHPTTGYRLRLDEHIRQYLEANVL